MLLVGTDDGLFEVDGRRILDGAVAAVDGPWVVVDEKTIVSLADRSVIAIPLRAWCVADYDGRPLVGTAEAGLFLGADRVASFDAVPTRGDWYTPWGAPPDVRSLAVAPDGTVFVNVHVGGVWRAESLDGPWTEVVAVDDDTHHVVALPGAIVVVAAAVGFGMSMDGGRSFTWTANGLHGSYCRAVAVADDTVLLAASTGPFTKAGAVYRRSLHGDEPFLQSTETFPFNVDTFQLAGSGSVAAFGTEDGRVFVSESAGRQWREMAFDRGPVRSVSVT